MSNGLIRDPIGVSGISLVMASSLPNLPTSTFLILVVPSNSTFFLIGSSRASFLQKITFTTVTAYLPITVNGVLLSVRMSSAIAPVEWIFGGLWWVSPTQTMILKFICGSMLSVTFPNKHPSGVPRSIVSRLTCWYIWNNRNKSLFEPHANPRDNQPCQVAKWILAKSIEWFYYIVHNQYSSRKETILVGWSPPSYLGYA